MVTARTLTHALPGLAPPVTMAWPLTSGAWLELDVAAPFADDTHYFLHELTLKCVKHWCRLMRTFVSMGQF